MWADSYRNGNTMSVCLSHSVTTLHAMWASQGEQSDECKAMRSERTADVSEKHAIPHYEDGAKTLAASLHV
jgi:hypothetical protein